MIRYLGKNRIIAIMAALGIVLGTLFLFPRESLAQSNQAEYDFSSAKNAIATLSQFPQEINRYITEVSQTSLGPWKLDVSCCTDYFIWCLNTRNFGYRVDYSGSRSNLENVIRRYEQNSREFSNSFSPIGDWFKIALPQFSSQFNAASERILAIQTEIRQGNGSTPEQRAEVTRLLNKLSSNLQEQSNQLKVGMSSLATFLQNQNNYQRIITNVNNGLNPSIQATLSKMQDFVNQQPCRGDADAQFNSIQQQFTNSVQKINNTLITLNTRTQEMDKSISILLGTITNFITKYQLIANQLNATENTQLGSVIQSLHLTVAKQAWEDLAKYAAEQLA
ncbi:hypothetical protein [Anabaena azotica]|uniref:Uncharacterized protein n=1 Tax=Anabaena azotica FACHB-119 TaxID=947527 RepID=A0ABR8DEC7_9NOST|nr:hypothetical protein [Anabaena azotica]MBD2505590.1 hypothetical protein [Anabaena azotica FACHB-119]